MSKIDSLGLAEKATKVGLWRYRFSENDNCCAFQIDKTVEGDVVIPETVDYKGISYSVVAIVNKGEANKKMVSCHIPDSVRFLGSGAFSGCLNLKNIDLPHTLEEIGDSAFSETAISQIELPEGIVAIPAFTFCACENLEQIVIPESVKSIGKSAFKRCSKLAAVTFPEKLEEIREEAFWMCSALKQVSIPSNVSTLALLAFHSCQSLEEVTVQSDCFRSEAGFKNWLVNGAEKTFGQFSGCRNLKYAIVPDAVADDKIMLENIFWESFNVQVKSVAGKMSESIVRFKISGIKHVIVRDKGDNEVISAYSVAPFENLILLGEDGSEIPFHYNFRKNLVGTLDLSEGGKYSIDINDAEEESRIYSVCLPSLFVSLDGLGMKGILQAPDDAVLIDKFWFNDQEVSAVWQEDDEN